MALDPKIPLQAKAPDINPLATLLQVGQYKQQQAVTNRLTMDTNASQAVGQAIQRNTDAKGNVNYAGVQADVAKDSNATYGLQGATSTNLSQQGANISNQAGQVKLTGDQQTHLFQWMHSLSNKPDLSFNDVVDAANQAGKLYNLPPDMIKQSIVNMPTEPGQLKTYMAGKIAALQQPSEQLRAMMPTPTLTSDGAANTYRDTNPITNPGIVGTSYQQKLSPAQAIGRLETVGPNGQPGSIPVSDTVPPNLLPAGMQGSVLPAGRYPQQPQQPQQPVRPGLSLLGSLLE